MVAQAAKKPCRAPACVSYATDHGYCDKHKHKIHQADRERGTAHERGYDSKWNKARLEFLAIHPLCVKCTELGLTVGATLVDHIIPHKGDKKLFWRRSNWQSLCKPCHDFKTATEDGGSWRPQPKSRALKG
jgi:5-methylcytosine-specific restriction endonuclease McrA